jgi:hypothetical protein
MKRSFKKLNKVIKKRKTTTYVCLINLTVIRLNCVLNLFPVYVFLRFLTCTFLFYSILFIHIKSVLMCRTLFPLESYLSEIIGRYK